MSTNMYVMSVNMCVNMTKHACKHVFKCLNILGILDFGV